MELEQDGEKKKSGIKLPFSKTPYLIYMFGACIYVTPNLTLIKNVFTSQKRFQL